jgi:asparagine synthase (glutamine-hydrolysing)
MPGIFGIIAGKRNEDRSRKLVSMAASMSYEPYFRQGTYVNDRLGISVGWVDHPGTFSDCLPIWNESQDICLFFTGEVYGDSATIEWLRKRGHQFSGSNASYLVHLYEERQQEFFSVLNGAFSGLLIDIKASKAVLFNDRYGLNRVHVHEDQDAFYFSSEAKALLSALPNTRSFDTTSLGEYLSCGTVLQDRTLFSGISLLPPASAWEFQPFSPHSKAKYFAASEWEDSSPLPPEEFYQRLKEVWTPILPRYFADDQKVALSLTGGVDSRMILAWAKICAPDLPCYTFGGRYRDCADVTLARQLAGISGHEHHLISLDSGFLESFPTHAPRAIFVSDGAMDVTGTVDLYVQTIARGLAPTRMSGVYGGEILRRLVIFRPDPTPASWLAKDLVPSFTQAVQTYGTELDGHRLSFIAFKQAPWAMTGKFAIERSQVTFRTPYFDNELVSLAYRAPASVIQGNEISLRLIADGNRDFAGVPTDRGLGAHSLPGLSRINHLWQQFTFKAEYAYDYGMPQWLARTDRVFSGLHFERLFLGRHKFHHFRIWYRHELSRFVQDTLLDPKARSRPYLQPGVVEAMVRGHVRGTRNHTLDIHKLLSLELINRTLLEGF